MAEEQNTGAVVDTSATPTGIDADAFADEFAAEVFPPAEDEQQTEQAAGAEPKLPASEATPPPTVGKDPAPVEAPAATPAIEPPDTWTKEAKAEWAKLPPTIQGEVAKREADIAKYVGETRGKVNIADGFSKMLEPYQPIFQQYGVNAWNHVDALLKAHSALMFGNPQQKATMAFALLKDAGVDPSKLTGGNPLDAIAPQNQENAALRQRIAQLEQGVTGVTSSLNAERAAEREAQVVAFAEDPAHPHFYAVWQDIHSLIQSGAAKTLQDAYDKATWSNPVVRQQMLDAQQAEKAERERKANVEKVTNSRRAASVNVRGRDNSSGAAAVSGNWENTLEDTLADIRSRDS